MTVLEKLNTLSLEELRNENVLMGLMREWGLHDDPVIDLGSTNEAYRVPMGMIQIPEQLAPCLIYLSRKKIKSYLEVGVFSGSSFAFICAYLRRFNPLKSTALDLGIHRDQRYFDMTECENLVGTSELVKGRKYDLCFIDADHKYESVKQDYKNVGQYAKFCIIHDIQDEGTVKERDGSGTVIFWNELKQNHKVIEFNNHPDQKRIMGIGVRL